MASNLALQLFLSANGVSDFEKGMLPGESVSTAPSPVAAMRTAGGMQVALDDGTQTLTLSDAQGRNLLTISALNGQIRIQAANKVVVEAPQIELGQGYAGLQPLVLGDSLLAYLNRFVLAYTGHQHIAGDNVPVGQPISAETPPPATPLDYLSQRVKTG